MLLLDGVYLIDREQAVFRHLPASGSQALEGLIQAISQRVGAYLEREGLLVRDIETGGREVDPGSSRNPGRIQSHPTRAPPSPAKPNGA